MLLTYYNINIKDIIKDIIKYQPKLTILFLTKKIF